MQKQVPVSVKENFKSDQEIRWCPGCGDYAILSALQKVMPKLGIAKEKIVFISGIGCAGRLPYYMDCYGFHTIHGRAVPIATGLAITRPDLSIWVIIGDGDGLSIGLGHLIHCMRRNINLNILLVNNQIYGLTKGQSSPTSQTGIDEPLNPLVTALAANCSFVARSFDVDQRNLQDIFYQAAKHSGTVFIEILQNCNVFNDGAFMPFTRRDQRAERIVYLQDDELLVFGENKSKGLMLTDHNQLKITDDLSKVLRHKYNNQNIPLPMLLSTMSYPDFPVAMGILRSVKKNTYIKSANSAESVAGESSLENILSGGQAWEHFC